MSKRFKLLLIVLIVALSAVFMVQFKNSHSAKERLREAGIRYYRLGLYDDASECFALALRQREAFDTKYDRDIYFYLADAEMKQKDYSSAITYYEKLVGIGEKSKDLYGNLGICYHEQGKDELCYENLKLASSAEDADSTVIYTLMLTCENLGRFSEVEEYAKQGYRMMSSSLTKESKEAVKSNDKSLTTKVKTELKQYATFAYLNAKYDEAYQAFKLLFDSGEDDVAPYLASTIIEQGKYEEALNMLLSYLDKYETNALVDAKLVYCYMQLKRYEDALALIDQAMAYPSQGCQKELLYEKGVALEYTGDFDEAYSCFSEYVEKYSDDANAKRELDFLSSRI
ncbi:MAG: tetratricopeptide repeat protein [Lachnospiraceae bacterium]|nr:tetratricopeptide repeat protein [Lachnospiraceae bacterium]